jgi:hypothetical protein
MKFTTPHWVLAGLTLLVSIMPQVAAAFPSLATVCADVQQFGPLLLGALGLATGSVLAKQVSK